VSYRYPDVPDLSSWVLSTELDFGILLVHISRLEASFQDRVRASRALSCARNVHASLLATFQYSKPSTELSEKLATLGELLKTMDETFGQAFPLGATAAVTGQRENRSGLAKVLSAGC
jgi:hypothetical protein